MIKADFGSGLTKQHLIGTPSTDTRHVKRKKIKKVGIIRLQEVIYKLHRPESRVIRHEDQESTWKIKFWLE